MFGNGHDCLNNIKQRLLEIRTEKASLDASVKTLEKKSTE
jgi:hypothetical protein